MIYRTIVTITLLMLSMSSSAQAADKAQPTIDKALNYLKTQQKSDGSWQGPNDPPAVTALVLRAFVREGNYSANDPFLKNGYAKLLSYQMEEGGIYKDMLSVYNTAIAVSALSAANDPAFRPRIDKAVDYLKSLQWSDTIAGLPKNETVAGPTDVRFGGWGYGKKGRPDGSNLNLAMDALHDAGLKPTDKAFQNAVAFVTRMQNSSETNDQPWAGNDGGFVYTPASGGESFAGEYQAPGGQRMLRSYGSMTYSGFKSMIYAGLTKDDPRVKAAFNWISRNWTLDENPGMKLNDPKTAQYGMYYYYYTLSRALNAYGQPTIIDPQGKSHDWRTELIDKLASLQRPDGSFIGDKRWMEDNPVLATAYAVQSIQEARK